MSNDVEAYRRSLEPHRHTWEPLRAGSTFVWCPGCGRIEPAALIEDTPETT